MTLPAYSPVPVTDANVIAFIKTDPNFSPLFTAAIAANPGADAPILAIANAVSSAYQVPNGPLTEETVTTLYDPDELNTFTAAMEGELELLMQNGTLVIGHPNIQADIVGLFANYPKTLANLRAVFTQNGTPWSYYFGVGSSASSSVLDSARNSGAGHNF